VDETKRADELVERTLAGDLGAFDGLVGMYEKRVYNLALRLTRTTSDAEDATQEAFLRAFRGLKSFRHGSSFFTWLYRIAANCAITRVRSRARRARVESALVSPEEDGNPDPPDPKAETPPEAVARAERVRLVRAAIGSLSPESRTVVVLRDMEGLAYEEIAGVLNESLSAVKSRLHRAREALAARLRKVLA